MIEITKTLEFDAGHRVLGHEGRCACLHGHRYKIEVTVTAEELDCLGRVIDFSCLKLLIGGWIDANWDHNMILHPDDPLLRTVEVINRTPYVMPRSNPNPTAENIAKELYKVSSDLLSTSGLKIVSICVWETPTCRAVFVPR